MDELCVVKLLIMYGILPQAVLLCITVPYLEKEEYRVQVMEITIFMKQTMGDSATLIMPH